jgi:transposase
MSDYKGAALMLPALPKAKELPADKGYDADWFRAALAKRSVAACIPSKSNRKVAIPYGALLYKQCHKIENMFGVHCGSREERVMRIESVSVHGESSRRRPL